MSFLQALDEQLGRATEHEVEPGCETAGDREVLGRKGDNKDLDGSEFWRGELEDLR